jgi:hypothetical protein
MKNQILLLSFVTFGLSAESWVASTGSDTNACTRSAPCKTFQHAHDVTTAGGLINVVDAADYGTVTIQKAITIDGSNLGSIGTTSTAAINVKAGASDVVYVRNLAVHGRGAQYGIYFFGGAQFVLENVEVSGFTVQCINATVAAGSSASDLLIKDSTIENCGSGITVSGAGANITSEIVNSHVAFVAAGFIAYSGKHRISNSTFTGSAAVEELFAGIISEPPNLAQISVDNCEVSGFGTGVLAYAGTISVSRSHIAYNTTGVAWQASATLTTYGNNIFSGNATDGTFNKTLTLH